ncbi:MAG: hypothetical protein FWF80_07940 [Defluviitaleaceae bacterium]|nr:hypothetical protein [Defluviitaleaceae bacterium]
MTINISNISNQANQLRMQVSSLNSSQISISSYQRNLNTHWRGSEMQLINQALDNHAAKIAKIATELDIIINNIIQEADRIKMEEETAIRNQMSH